MSGRTCHEWQKLVAEYRRSQESLGVFCKRHGLKLSTFHYWVTKSNKSIKPVKPVKMLPVAEVPSLRSLDSVELILPQGNRLRFSAGAAAGYIASIVKALA